MFYRLFRALIRHSLWVFYRRIEIEGLEDVPTEGPLLLAANHPNTMMDALLVAMSLDRQVGFVGKATLFKNPLVGAFFRYMGGIPIARKQDGPVEGGAAQNQNVLEACEISVAAGNAILIFPEGISQEQPRLQPLKTGLARIALGAERRNPGQVTVVPTALVYDDHETFRSSARVRYLAPIQVAPFLALGKDDPDSFAPARALTAALDEALKEEVVHVEDSQNDPLVAAIDDLVGKDRTTRTQAGGRLAVTPIVAKAVNHFVEHEPERVAVVAGQLERYQAALSAAGVDDDAVRKRARHSNALRAIVFWLASPIALWGVINHFVLYQLPRIFLRLVRLDPLYNASAKLLIGLMGLVATYSVQGFLVYEALSRPLASQLEALLPGSTPLGLTIVYLVTLPICGMAALVWLEAWGSRRKRAAAAGAQRRLGARLPELRTLRADLFSSIDTALADYLNTLSESSTEDAAPTVGGT
ncbi:MAG: 1-acyl-sn-glycerol-3-phosphate acyltransferase [Planctomycetes bacterium]|nr:1-acyl-sn-glycerol-3-phosphate acyltransferase [Planctomycetota bacterium]